ncbi:hypothetical protein [Desulforamulus ruminis]|uniref:hypothetical protein n=1 Tax=Desulforamulus ruminis TaxID=1564 RepID=UPI0016519DFD|nr:hypothetical protein [Desulforamulus ruminis]
MEKESNAIQFYREELKRIAWRLQYKSKVTLKRELPLELVTCSPKTGPKEMLVLM